ncbi:MAG: ISL3 family transposase [Desulfobulbaceae bacterium]|nr:ISL3 family transposase [Desulfobulbaceae bacterium]
MESNAIFALGLGLTPPWKLVDQALDTGKHPHELKLLISADRGALFPCPTCGNLCKAHDFKEMTWRHLNFFQHHCYITAPVPRTNCPEHGVKRITVPWAREGSHFTLLFEQVAMTMLREMPVLVAARHMEVTDKRLWRLIFHYVNKALGRIDLSKLTSFGLDETSSRRHHKYVTIFIDMDRADKPVVFATPGKGKETVAAFTQFLKEHGGNPENVLEVVSDMSGAFVASVKTHFKDAEHTVDWFHVVQLFTKVVDEVRRIEAKSIAMPKTTRWAVLKNADGQLTEQQIEAIAELAATDMHTASAWRIKEALRWIRKATSERAAKWRISAFLKFARELCDQEPILAPVTKAVDTVEKHRNAILARWRSEHSSARLEGLNSLFQAAKARARGYRNDQSFIAMIYLIGAPIQKMLFSI